MNPDIVVWNTGRLYGREGQVIAAKEVEGGVVFADVSRMIDGFVVASPERIAREGVRRVTMWGYDTGEPTSGGGFKYNYTWVPIEHRPTLSDIMKVAGDEVRRILRDKDKEQS